MGRFALIRRRFARRAFDPARAPHTPLVRELIAAHVPPLHKRLRERLVESLVLRLVELEQRPDELEEETPAGRLALLALRIQQAIRQLEIEERMLARRFAAFSHLYAQHDDPDEQLDMLATYLRENATSPAQLRGDLGALKRNLGPDALRERHNLAVLECSVQVELGLLWLAHAIPAIAAGRDAAAEQALRRLFDARLAESCGGALIGGRRWHVRWAAGQALVALAEVTTAAGLRVGEEAIAATHHAAITHDEHPWVQAAALEAAVLLDPVGGAALLATRVLEPRAARDLFLRKLALRIAVHRLPAEDARALVGKVVAAVDPSEHVRLGLVELCAGLGWAGGGAHLGVLAGLGEPRELSPKVRGAAAIAARRLAAAARTNEPDVVRAAAAVVAGVARDTTPFPLVVACEELAGLAADLAADTPELLLELAPGWLEVLGTLIRDDATTPHVAETAAAAAEAIERERDPVRRALTIAIKSAVDTVRPGRRGTVDLSALPEALGDAARDDHLLGRILADLTRRDWGVSVSRVRDRLVVWRGDRFRWRLWRVLNELRSPLPNKRQAWLHTVGRTYPGTVRAHPGLLEEATATAVPGERVNVDSEGSWCRHLPMIDDVISLPILRPDPVRIVSSLGTTVVEPPASLWWRIRNSFTIAWDYRRLAALRLASLRAYRDPQRKRYIELLETEHRIQVHFEPHPRPASTGDAAPASRNVADLFEDPPRQIAAASDGAVAATSVVPALALGAPFGDIRQFFENNAYYFLSLRENSQVALVAFAGALATVFWTTGWHKRRQIDVARSRVPLSLGGWGTRGKSGTERLKAGLFDGLGFEVFVKTTGCEAMFIHSAPLQQPVEIFIYRPYDKATIWEQMTMLRLGTRLRCQVFLWECMALNPKYVHLLQHDWMHDDIVTLTNCYPDHEDIQGPVGFNVAEVITEFIPTKSTLITSEMSYLPLFTTVAEQRGTTMHTVGEREAELIGDDVLDLYPYREHPRNIALVTRCAVEVKLDPDLALLTMAENVVPDLGVLKSYPRARLRGRYLTFVCGNSANERTGFMGNWRRMKLDQLDLERDPEKLVITVVNNRADRIARSEVFARILVRDIACDRHVLIGTNLKGLLGFIETALDDYLGELSLIESGELAPGHVPSVVASRVARELANLRIPPATSAAALARLTIYARPAGLVIDPDRSATLATVITGLFDSDPAAPVEIAAVRRTIAGDLKLTAALAEAVVAAPAAAQAASPDDCPESLTDPTREDVVAHFVFELARMQIRSRIEAQLRRVFEAPTEQARLAFRSKFAAAFRAMFLSQVTVVEDSGATGDQIIDQCARVVPPGSEVTLMGTQNIKGTGLDFVYRWLALDKVVSCLRQQTSPRPEQRMAALIELEAFEDNGLVDTGLCRAVLARPSHHPAADDELAARQRIATRVEAIWKRRKDALVEQRKVGYADRLAAWGEGWLDWVDSARRSSAANQLIDDLVASRISHQRAAVEMRKVVGRIKGGWLIKALRNKR